MNSLNILSARVSPPPTPGPTRSSSLAALASPAKNSKENQSTAEKLEEEEGPPPDLPLVWSADEQLDEQTALLGKGYSADSGSSDWFILPSQIASAFINSIRWVFSTLAAPGMYLIAFLYDDAGRFAPLRKLYGIDGSADDAHAVLKKNKRTQETSRRRPSVKSTRTPAKNSLYSGISSESESEKERSMSEGEIQDSASTARHTRSKSLQSSDEIAPARRSIRIKLNNDDSLRQRKHRKTQSTNNTESSTGTMTASEVSLAALRSPISPASSSLTKYPRAPAPPRPLIPARTPSYQTESPSGSREKKVLILDLDETLIHSMAKGGRMSTGHMVEVKLNTYIGVSGQASAGPQHPILYYVHKRPHCDDFLRRVCKWYDLVIFTASVQEYADPVIDWLELDRKFFSRRYYRQHCTYRHGAFIKDLSTVEADLSKVMILDNSPLSYMFHQDNAIPIEGWISDPQDNDLLHLVPLLEGLQYVTDVRALLALRGGEDGKHMSA